MKSICLLQEYAKTGEICIGWYEKRAVGAVRAPRLPACRGQRCAGRHEVSARMLVAMNEVVASGQGPGYPIAPSMGQAEQVLSGFTIFSKSLLI